MDEDGTGRDRGPENTNFGQGYDYEYDEAHDMGAGPPAEPPTPHRVDAPRLALDEGGDYGYDEAHDFGAP